MQIYPPKRWRKAGKRADNSLRQWLAFFIPFLNLNNDTMRVQYFQCFWQFGEEITRRALFEGSCNMACGWLASPAQPPLTDVCCAETFSRKSCPIKIDVFCMFTDLPAEFFFLPLFLLQKQPAFWFMSLQTQKPWSRRDLVHVRAMLVHMRHSLDHHPANQPEPLSHRVKYF